MSDARTVLREFSYLDCGWYPHEKASDKCARCDGFADAILAALAEAGLEIVQAHKWFVPNMVDYACCANCGIVRRADGKHRPCPGRVIVGPRNGGGSE